MPATQLDRLLYLQAGRCFFCDEQLEKKHASVEHLVPQSKGGSEKEHNAVACCKTLNGIFGSMDLKSKLTAILKQHGKFTCPAKLLTGDGESLPSSAASLGKPTPTAANRAELVLRYLCRNATNRPRTGKTLAHHLSQQVLKGASATQIEQVIARLHAEGHLTVAAQGRITYHLPPAKP